MSKSAKDKDAQAAPAVLEYLNKQNRPYSAVDVQNNLHNVYGKTAVVKALESLAADGKIKSKVYNKQVVFVADQNQLEDVNDAEMKQMDLNIAQISENIKQLVEECKTLESTLGQLNSEMTTDDALKMKNKLAKECSILSDKLTSLKSNTNSVSPAERETIVKSHTSFTKEWKKRKRMCNDMLNAVLEGYPKSKKALIEEAGIETDEDVGVKI
ncbi:hypothetical protein HELRODRAFT_64425 [Helobdella robusta]|uniref:Homologous-pairing protein 2 homolog n=1 Tax=Helobdella robusta TaxID=6412 RepID=T1FXU5_HELRO|nr:hypothetical protein HELRODRAFT_64425 [Helobdella robusta]ESO06399.1 hypothetical protein HELRODRAFT_64425 [Helobdella robusta]